MDTPWERATDQQRRARRSEQALGHKDNARAQPNSGRLWWAKRDIRWGGFLIENRQTDKDSYAVKKKEFAELTRQAIGSPPGQLPAMRIDFGDLRLIVIREEDHEFFQKLVREDAPDDDAA